MSALTDSVFKHKKNYVSSTPIHPYFITGFFEAEGCFHVSITINKTCKIGWQVKACFAISLEARDLALLKRIQSYFVGIGEINKCGKMPISIELPPTRN